MNINIRRKCLKFNFVQINLKYTVLYVIYSLYIYIFYCKIKLYYSIAYNLLITN